MTEQMQQALTQILLDTTSFAKEQLPEVAQQLLTYKLWTYSFCESILLIISGTFFFVSRKCWKEGGYDKEAPTMFFGAIGVVFLLFACCVFTDILQIIYAPKLFLIEYAGHLMRGK